jgi:GMP synthase-like glutamine amidotransferase
VSAVLVVENDPDARIGRLGEWLTGSGLRLAVVRPHTGEPLPGSLAGYAGLVVLGGGQSAAPDPAGTAGPSWLGACESLLRKAVRHRVPTLAICLGAQLLATAHGGRVAPAAAGPEVGPALVARRDAAGADPLFAQVPFTPDVLAWHHDEVAELPAGAVLLAASTRYPHQAFRVGPAAWGLQFHIEPDLPMVAGWVAANRELLADLGVDPAGLLAATGAVLDDLAEVWQPFAGRFAALVRGELAATRPELPIRPAGSDPAGSGPAGSGPAGSGPAGGRAAGNR